MDIYISWVQGLPYDMEALSLLRESGIGIELTNIDEQPALLKKEGIRYSSHNPSRDIGTTLSDPCFIDKIQDTSISGIVSMSDPEIVGFHTRPSFAYHDKTSELLENKLSETVSANLHEADLLLPDKRVIFETPVYRPEENDPEKTLKRYLTSAGFVSSILERDADRSYLFDVSHNFVSAFNKSMEGLVYDTDSQVGEILEVSSGRVEQIHLNSPLLYHDMGNIEIADEHMPFVIKDPSYEQRYLQERVLEIAEEVLKRNDVKILTLEIDSKLDPFNHVCMMRRQKMYLEERLGLR